MEFLPKGDLYLLNQNSPELQPGTAGVWGGGGDEGIGGGDLSSDDGGYFERGDPAVTRGQDNFKELWMREYVHGRPAPNYVCYIIHRVLRWLLWIFAV